MQLDKQVDAGLSGLIEGYIRQLFDDRNVSPANQKKLWEHYYSTLAKGVDLGYNPKPEMYDPALAHSLKYDIAKFSAFKETSFRKQLEASLTKDGSIVPWNEFKKMADGLNIEYNRRWLKTEYNHTVARANMAEKWQGFVADKDLYPNLRYVTVGDARVRDQHKILDGTVLPVDHPFWKTHTAPLDWGCRCNIEQTDDAANKTVPEYKTKAEFMNNPYYSGKVFAEPAYKKEFTNAESKAIEKDGERKFAEKNYKTVEIPFKGKGKILSSALVDINGIDYKDVIKCCTHFAKLGKVTEILPRLDAVKKNPLYDVIFGKLKGSTYYGKCPDFRVNNLFYELEGFDVKTKKSLSNMISRGLKQSSRIVIKDNGSTINHIKKVIKFSKIEGKIIDEVWILRDLGILQQVY